MGGTGIGGSGVGGTGIGGSGVGAVHFSLGPMQRCFSAHQVVPAGQPNVAGVAGVPPPPPPPPPPQLFGFDHSTFVECVVAVVNAPDVASRIDCSIAPINCGYPLNSRASSTADVESDVDI